MDNLERIKMRDRTHSMPTKNSMVKPKTHFINNSRVLRNGNKVLPFKSNKSCDGNYLHHYGDPYDQCGDCKLNICAYAKLHFDSGNQTTETEMRTRTSSMPTRNEFVKPQFKKLCSSHFGIEVDPDIETYMLRSFEINAKGAIVKRSDSLLSRSTTSIGSGEEDYRHQLGKSSRSRTPSSSRESVTMPSCPGPWRILVTGDFAVGKTGLTQQFMTSEYLGGFDTSFGKQHIYVQKVIHKELKIKS